MKAPVGLLSDRTVLAQQDGGASPRQVHVDTARFLWQSIPTIEYNIFLHNQIHPHPVYDQTSESRASGMA